MNLFEGLPKATPQEIIDILAETEGVRIERIVSTGHTSGDDWYDQEDHEWVVVLQGAAELEFREEGIARKVALSVGDHVLIRPHQQHRVHWTSLDEPTVWLAVFFSSPME